MKYLDNYSVTVKVMAEEIKDGVMASKRWIKPATLMLRIQLLPLSTKFSELEPQRNSLSKRGIRVGDRVTHADKIPSHNYKRHHNDLHTMGTKLTKFQYQLLPSWPKFQDFVASQLSIIPVKMTGLPVFMYRSTNVSFEGW